MVDEPLINILAAMHISPSVKSVSLRTPATKFHFFKDKVKLFYDFDNDSIIIEKNKNNEIMGFLIYTYNEQAFNKFAGYSNFRFYIRLFKTLFGYYGVDFKKFFLAAQSMIGKNYISNHTNNKSFGKIWVLLVMEEFRREGVADSLLKKCIQAMENRKEKILQVTVRKDNNPAIKAYQKNGFVIVGSCKESSGDSYIMELIVMND